MPHTRPQQTGKPVSVSATISMLDSKLRLLAQRIKVIENNIQVVARTLVNHNKKIKELESAIEGGAGSEDRIVDRVIQRIKEMGVLEARATGNSQERFEDEIRALRNEIARLKAEVSRIKYTVDAINPAEVITIYQLKEALEKEINELRREGKLG